MVMINQFPTHRPAFVEGVFRLHKILPVDFSGQKRVDAILADSSGQVHCKKWAAAFTKQAFLNRQFACNLLLKQETRRHTRVFLVSAELLDASSADPSEKTSDVSSTRSDPTEQLSALIRSCPQRDLRHFIQRILCDRSIASPFFRLPASRDYHHDYPGGLIEHSVETANIAISSLPGLSKEESALTLTAALFHDIGKIRTLHESGRKTIQGRVIRHEFLTLECLAEPLKELETRWPDGATALRYLLTYTPEQIKRPLLPCAMAVSYADRMSASLSARRKAQKNQPVKSQFWRTESNGPQSWFWTPRRSKQMEG